MLVNLDPVWVESSTPLSFPGESGSLRVLVLIYVDVVLRLQHLLVLAEAICLPSALLAFDDLLLRVFPMCRLLYRGGRVQGLQRSE